MQAARATEAFNCVQFQWVEYSACARVKREKSAALLKIFGIEGITDQSDRIKVAAAAALFAKTSRLYQLLGGIALIQFAA